MSDYAIWLRRGAIEPHWQLGDLASTAAQRALLFGWEVPASNVDAGVPSLVAGAWSRALGATSRVTFLCSDARPAWSTDWLSTDDDFTRAAGAPTGIAKLITGLQGSRAPIGLVCSKRPETIARAFDDARFSWTLQSQVYLLSPPDGPPPEITPEEALALLQPAWVAHAAPLDARILAVARPAVDGDAIGLLVRDHRITAPLLHALARECHAAGIDWLPV